MVKTQKSVVYTSAMNSLKMKLRKSSVEKNIRKKDKVVKNKHSQGTEFLSVEIYESQIAERT